jgi:hypothetical protein
MASPPTGMSPQQTNSWANAFTAGLKQRGLDPASFGFSVTGQNFQTPAGRNPATLASVMQPPGKTLKGPTSSPAPTKAPDMTAYMPAAGPAQQRHASGDYIMWGGKEKYDEFMRGRQQSSPPIVGNAPNGRPVTGAYGKPQPLPSPAPENYHNAAGQRFGVVVDQNPFATQQQLSASYEQLANSQGYYRRQQSPSAPQPTPAQPSKDPRLQGVDWGEYLRNGGYRAPQAPAQPMTRPSPPRPSPAQPIQPPSQGTPYAPMQPFSVTFGGEGEGNLANMPEDQRPPGFTASYTDPFGNQASQPQFAQRDALIEMLNQQMLPYQMGQQQGAPTFNLPAMWGQAGDMVNAGWTNPLAGLFG